MLRLPPWGEDSSVHRRTETRFDQRSDEACVALFKLSLAGYHGLPMTAAWTTVIKSMDSIGASEEPYI